nr:FAD-dependent oxidoreductase [Bradyrhizobium sp. CW7]
MELDRGSYSPVDRIVKDLAQTLKAAGVSLYERTSIKGIRQGPSNILLQTLHNREHFARRAVLAIGPWLPDLPLVAHLTDTPRLRVKKVVALHLAARPTPKCPMIGLFDDYAFLIPMIEEGYWLFSFTSQEWDVRADCDELHVSSDDLARATAILAKWFSRDVPAVASARVFCDLAAEGMRLMRPKYFTPEVRQFHDWERFFLLDLLRSTPYHLIIEVGCSYYRLIGVKNDVTDYLWHRHKPTSRTTIRT